MDQTQAQGEAGSGAMMERPAVLMNATETQLEELARQFTERDRQGWDALTASYDWTPEDSQAVWAWFGLRSPPTEPGAQIPPEAAAPTTAPGVQSAPEAADPNQGW
jgi:hypothetical protein